MRREVSRSPRIFRSSLMGKPRRRPPGGIEVMKKMFSILIAIGVSTVFAAVSLAQEPTTAPGKKTPGIKRRQKNQQKRIGQGVESGELTARETIKLEKEQREIQQEKKEAKSDGTVTKEERNDIHQDQNKASRHIYRAKHNRRDRN